MKITIITPAYNCENTIWDTLDSVVSQDYPDIEYIIVDGDSKDHTYSVIQQYVSKYPWIRAISEEDKGLYYALNKGLKLATGEVIGILNAGDFYTRENTLSRIMTVFKEYRTDTVYGDLEYVKKYRTDKVVRYWKSGRYRRRRFYNGWAPPHPAFFAKRELYEKYGGFDTGLVISSDYELMLRFLFKNRATAKYLPSVLVRMPEGGISNSSWRNRWKANKEDRLAWKKNGIRPLFYTRFWKPLHKIRQYFH